MATNMATNAGEEIVSDGDPNQVVPPNDAKQEVSEGKEQNPYGDFASAEPPELIQPGPPETRMKRVDPRHQWINTDKAIPYLCKLCDYTADCSEAYQYHCMSPRHIKRAIEEFNIKIPKRLEEKEEKKPPPQYNCQVCLVTCNSDSAWNAHLIGQKHRKALEKQGAEKAQQKAQERGFMNTAMNTGFNRGGRGGGGPVRGGAYLPGHSRKPYEKPVHAVQQPSLSGPIGAKDFATYPEPLIGLEYVTEIQVIGQSPRYHCELCDSKFDHNLKFPHLVGSKHRFNVLKEKVPDVAQSIRAGVQKRSELSSKLLEEARKLEMMLGRQQVKTRVEKSPFNVINNQVANNQTVTHQMGRGAKQPWQSARGRGHGNMRGGQGAQGGSFAGRGQATMRGGRGGQQGNPHSYNQQQPTASNRGGRGRTRVSPGGKRQNQSWGQNYPYYESQTNQTFPAGSYGENDDVSIEWNSGRHGEGNPMLPPEAFKPRSPPRLAQYNDNSDDFYDSYYGNNSGSNYEFNSPYRNQTTSDQRSDPYGQMPSANEQRFHSYGHAPTTAAGGVTSGSSSGAGSASSRDRAPNNMSLLQGAIEDLGKLVTSEEDASMALHVSNALTQALLQFRMNNLPKESLGDSNTTGAVGAASTNPGT
ncbi:uncharacterized protein [Pocillopora verrucosa]|uniref:uncharacterized protein n=1 Tax=Pocillopora verrucosa TaxID=203993 RepID=UPI0033413635